MQQWIFDIRSTKFFLILISFAILTYLVYAEITRPINDSIILYAQSFGGNKSVDVTMQIFTEIGSVFYMIIFCIILFIKKSTRRIGLVLILSVLAGTIASSYMKDFVGQERPKLDFAGEPFPIALEQDVSFFGKGSYPSGHATRTAAFAFVIGFALSQRFPRGCYLMWIYPLVVSISRVFILQHFPMDVIGGTLLGILVADIVSKKLKLHLIFDKSKT
ncbi:MAG: phosphatase PAP2 family protein [Nitrosopumilaceae archaeon]